MPELEIIGAPQSNFVWVCRIAAAEKGLAVKLDPARPHTPVVDAIHPSGKIPVMRHGDVTLFESRAICAYIDKAFPGPSLIPADAKSAALTVIHAATTMANPCRFQHLPCNGYWLS